MSARKRAPKTSFAQYLIFVQELENNEMFRTGKVALTSHGSLDNIWESLTTRLNAQGSGPEKSIEGWKKVFTEWKSSVKKKARELRQEQLSTGGGPATKPHLTDLEERLISAIGKSCVDGMSTETLGLAKNVEESNDEPIPSTSVQVRMETDPDTLCHGQQKKKIKQKTAIKEIYSEKTDKLIEVLSSIDTTLKNIYELKLQKRQSRPPSTQSYSQASKSDSDTD